MASTAVESVQTGFASIVGESHVVSDPAACAALAIDGKAPAHVVYPQTAQQAADVLRYAAENRLAVIPCRSGTKIGIGNPPRRYDVALSLKEMNQVWYYEPADLVVSVEPGMKFGNLQHFLSRHGLWLPLDPAGGARASVGGILATNSTGSLRIHYGAPRDIILGMKIATTAGKVIKTGGRVVKNVAGYDLAKLLVGSYGTLGVIVEATFKLYPMPRARRTFVARLDTLAEAREIRRRLLSSQLRPHRLVLVDAATSQLARGLAPKKEPAFEMWLEAAGTARVLDRYDAELSKLTAGGRASFLPADGAESAWAALSDSGALWATASWPQGLGIKATLPIAATETFIERIGPAVEPGAEWAVCAGPGTGQVRIGLAASQDTARSAAFVERLRALAAELDGSVVVERCPVEVKSKVDAWGPAGDDFEVMRRLKAAWDPNGILSPGRFVGGV